LADCGSLVVELDTPRAEAEPVWRAGEACVRDHLDDLAPFVVRFHTPLIDSGTFDTVYTGREVAGGWSIQMFTEGSGSNFESHATAWSCDDLQPRGPNCTADTLFGSLCFRCTNPTKTSECKTN
jgi:hypothetical protein